MSQLFLLGDLNAENAARHQAERKIVLLMLLPG